MFNVSHVVNLPPVKIRSVDLLESDEFRVERDAPADIGDDERDVVEFVPVVGEDAVLAVAHHDRVIVAAGLDRLKT